jgi:hypothetical protein
MQNYNMRDGCEGPLIKWLSSLVILRPRVFLHGRRISVSTAFRGWPHLSGIFATLAGAPPGFVWRAGVQWARRQRRFVVNLRARLFLKTTYACRACSHRVFNLKCPRRMTMRFPLPVSLLMAATLSLMTGTARPDLQLRLRMQANASKSSTLAQRSTNLILRQSASSRALESSSRSQRLTMHMASGSEKCQKGPTPRERLVLFSHLPRVA